MAVGDASGAPNEEGTDQGQPPDPVDQAREQRPTVDTLAEQQALAALDELIAKVDSGPELSGSASRAESQPPPSEADTLAAEAPPLDGWYVAMKDNAQGPLTVDQLRELWSSGEIGADSLCWREGMSEWRALSRLPGMANAVSPRPREGLKALSAREPIYSPPSQPSFEPRASRLLKSLAEQEAKPPAPAPRRAPPPAVKAPPPPAEPLQPAQPLPPLRTYALPPEDEDERPARAAGVSGGKLFLSLFAASVLGGLVGGFLVKLTIPEPQRVVADEPEPEPQPERAVAVKPPPAPAVTATAPATPPPAPKAEPKPEPRAAEVKAAPPPKLPRAPAGEATSAPPAPPKKPAETPPPPKTPVDKDFQDLFGK